MGREIERGTKININPSKKFHLRNCRAQFGLYIYRMFKNGNRKCYSKQSQSKLYSEKNNDKKKSNTQHNQVLSVDIKKTKHYTPK